NRSTEDDQLLYRNDDGYSEVINFTFPYYNSTQSLTYVNTNGDITFKFPLSWTHPPVISANTHVQIAPFWADVDIIRYGQIWYKQSSTTYLLNRAESEVQQAFPDLRNFHPSSVLTVTWNKVPYHGGPNDEIYLRNTFQVVLTTNSVQSFVMFHYLKLDWADNAWVGFNAGDGVTNYTIEGSPSDDIVNLVTKSNVGVPGKFLFRVDGYDIKFPYRNITTSYTTGMNM
ncbi:sushi, nidogen and EGF-like domain-containing protein 1, partial [Argopecten irradians]|uniref:sushi, nidogen and EGF-like domain-containing protein 1 n=1 Tax=Argopecten irradians TaxID=31199 RepID=UPI003720728D